MTDAAHLLFFFSGVIRMRARSEGSNSELLQQLVDAAPTALIVLDLDANVIDANREACELLDRTRKELLGHSILDVWASDRLRGAVMDLIENAKRGHCQVDVEGSVSGAGRVARWTSWTASRLHAGGAARLVLIGRDVTERRRLEQLRGAEEALTRIAATCDSVTRAIPRLLRVLCRTLGWDMGELWTVDPLTPALRCDGVWTIAGFDADRRAEVREGMPLGRGDGLPGAAWSQGRAVRLSRMVEPISAPHAGTETALAFPVRGHDEIVAVVALSSEHPRVVDQDLLTALESLGLQVGVLFDRIRARENLRRTEDALRAIHQISTSAPATLGERLEALLHEGCRRFDMRKGLVLRAGPDDLELVAAVSNGPAGPLLGGSDRQLARQVLQHGESIRIERASDPSRPGSVRAYVGVPVFVEGEPFGALTFGSDEPRRHPFTAADREILAVMAQWIGAEVERTRLQEQLMEGERLVAIGMTAATFAHEVSNPLSNMALACELVQRDLAKPAGKAPAGVQLLKREVARLGRLLDEFRALSATRIVDVEDADLDDIVGAVLNDFAPTIEASGIRLERDLRAVPPCPLDRDKIRQIVVNLVKNAVEAMPAGGRLTVRVQCCAGGVRLEVSDTGNGLPEDIDVFVPFASTKRGGTGLGLPVVRQLVAAHAGQLYYETEANRGTTFVVELPYSRTSQTAECAPAPIPCN